MTNGPAAARRDAGTVPESSEARYRLRDMVPEAVSRALQVAAHRRDYPDGAIIYSQGEIGAEMYHIVSGNVRLAFLHTDGRELVYITFEPGDSFGFLSLVDGRPHPHTAEASGNVRLEVLSATAFATIRSQHRDLDRILLALLCMHMRSLSTFVAEAVLSDLSHRLARRLLEVSRPDLDCNPTINLSQGELALRLGASRQTINKLLKQFEEDGLVRLRYGTVILQDLDSLRVRAAMD